MKYIMLNVNTNLHLGSNRMISALPKGLEVDFIISYHDNTGEVFAASRTDIKIMQNRFDTVSKNQFVSECDSYCPYSYIDLNGLSEM